MKWTLSIFLFAFMVFGLLGIQACGESACDSFLDKVCDECKVELTDEWKAACACRNGGYVKAYGFHCKDTSSFDEDSCRMSLDLWSEQSCGMLMRQSPLRQRIPEDDGE